MSCKSTDLDIVSVVMYQGNKGDMPELRWWRETEASHWEVKAI